MKKRRISLILAAVLLIGLLMPPALTASAASKNISVNYPYLEELAAGSDNFYYFTLNNGGTVSVDFSSLQSISFNAWRVTLYDNNSNVLQVTDFGAAGTSSSSGFKTATSASLFLNAGSYYYRVSPVSTSSFRNDPYVFTVNYAQGSGSGGNQGGTGNDTIATAMTIQPNTVYNSRLASQHDAKVYKVNLTSNGSLQLRFTSERHVDFGCWTVYLYDEGQNEIQRQKVGYDGRTVGNERTNQLDKLRLGAGIYYIAVLPGGPTAWSNTEFKLYAEYMPENTRYYEKEPNNTKATANPLLFNSPMTGNMGSAGDIDYLYFTLSRAQEVELIFETPSSVARAAWAVCLMDDSGAIQTYYAGQAGETVNGVRTLKTPAVTLQQGTYYAAVYPVDAVSYSNEDYTLTIIGGASPGTPEKPSGPDTGPPPAATAGVNSTVNDRLSSGTDVKMYTFALAQHGSVVVRFQSDAQLNRGLWVVRLFDSLDRELYRGTCGAGGTVGGSFRLNESDKLRLPPGNYKMEVAPVSAGTYSESAYSFRIEFQNETLPAANGYIYEKESNDTSGTANAVEPGKYYLGNMSSANDADYFKVTLPDPGSLTVALSTPASVTTNYWMLRVYDEKLTKIYEGPAGVHASNDPVNAGYNLTLSSKLRLDSGVYYISVTPYSALFYSNLDYILSAEYTREAPGSSEIEPNNNFASANPLPLNWSLTGNISSVSDIDFFSVTLKKADALQIKLSVNQTINSGLWTVKLYDSERREIKSYRLGEGGYIIPDEGKRTLKTEAVPLQPGRYYISIAPYTQTEWSNTDYVLKVLDLAGSKVDGLIYLYDAPSGWARENVEAAFGYGLVPASFMRDFGRSATRGEFCSLTISFLTAATGKNIDAILAEKGLTINQAAFTDTSDKSILAAAALGIVQGKGGGIFDPNGAINRQEAAVMLMRLSALLGLNPNIKSETFIDRDKVESWALNAVDFVSGCADSFGVRVMRGHDNGRFEPLGGYTREQSYVTLYRLYNIYMGY